MEEVIKEAMNVAIKEAQKNWENNYQAGGPFGAVVVKDKKVIAFAHNTVCESIDPTAHAEINAIRKACKILNTRDLSDCILVINAEPCPMCLSAIIWSNIKEVYYANTKEDTETIGFRDAMIYEYIKGSYQSILKKHHIENEEAKKVFDEFMKIEEKNMY